MLAGYFHDLLEFQFNFCAACHVLPLVELGHKGKSHYANEMLVVSSLQLCRDILHVSAARLIIIFAFFHLKTHARFTIHKEFAK